MRPKRRALEIFDLFELADFSRRVGAFIGGDFVSFLNHHPGSELARVDASQSGDDAWANPNRFAEQQQS
jgi:hypothetical protein